MKKSWSTTKESLVNKARRRALDSVFFLFLVLLSLSWFLPRITATATAVIWYPAEQIRIWIANSNNTLPLLLRDKQELLKTIHNLEIKIATEQGTESTIKRLQIENDQLRSLVGTLPAERILARVIARPPELPYDLLLFDRGSRDGVVEGAPVFAGKDTVIGVVSMVTEKTSYAKLISDPQVSVTVFLVGPNIFTLAEGLGNGVVRVRVPQGIKISEADIVLLPAVDSGVIGVIEKVVTSPTNPERHGYITFSTNIQSLQYVSIGSEAIITPDFSAVVSSISNQISELLSVSVPPELLIRPEVIDVSATNTSTTTTNEDLPTND